MSDESDSDFVIDEDTKAHAKPSKNKVRNTKKDAQRKYAAQDEKHKRQEGVILKRWNRTHDREVFQYIREMLKQTKMDIQEFIFDESFDITNEKEQTVLWEMRLQILESTIQKCGWLNTPYFLLKRLRKLAKLQSFSFREMKELKKI